MNDKMTTSPQGVMAVGEALEWLRRLQNDRTVILRFSDAAQDTLAKTHATFAAMAAEVERLTAEVVQTENIALAAIEARKTAEARCEGLEAALRELHRCGLNADTYYEGEAGHTDGYGEWSDALHAAQAKLAATHTTGGRVT